MPNELVCTRCDRPIRVGAKRMQHLYTCEGCYSRALETYGACAGCGVDRLTPGPADDGGRLCCDCAEDVGDYICRRCGREGKRYLAGICGNCVLADTLTPLLDDGTGTVRAELVPLFEAIRQMNRPRVGIYWATKPHVVAMLQALGPRRGPAHPRRPQPAHPVALRRLPSRPAHRGRRPPAGRPAPDAPAALA
ncbi:hypothetical protein [Catenulispora rubra]|uniref:hypothetical protein n=1 Tax=Catenulispora rubra TaxID=280293 RepID=UPI001E2ED626|nr:hypothetical protein [Catenulispora rubra]